MEEPREGKRPRDEARHRTPFSPSESKRGMQCMNNRSDLFIMPHKAITYTPKRQD